MEEQKKTVNVKFTRQEPTKAEEPAKTTAPAAKVEESKDATTATVTEDKK